jgi:hypothetical protein
MAARGRGEILIPGRGVAAMRARPAAQEPREEAEGEDDREGAPQDPGDDAHAPTSISSAAAATRRLTDFCLCGRFA